MASNLDEFDNYLQVVEILRRGQIDTESEYEQIKLFLQRANLDIQPENIFQNPMLPEIISNMDTQIENWSYQQLGSIAMFPPEIQLLILSKMDLNTLNNLARTNRYYQDLLHNPDLLRLLSERFELKTTDTWESFRREYSHKYYTSDCDKFDNVVNCTVKAILYSEPDQVAREMNKLDIIPPLRKFISEAVGQRGSSEIYQIYQDIFTRKGYLVDKYAVIIKALEHGGSDVVAMIIKEWGLRVFEFIQPTDMLLAAATGGMVGPVKFAIQKGATRITEALELAIQHHRINVIDYIINSDLSYNPYIAFYRSCTAKLSEFVWKFWRFIIVLPDYIRHINDVMESVAEFGDMSFFHTVVDHIKSINRFVVLDGGRILAQAVLSKNRDMYNDILALKTLSSWNLEQAEVTAIRTHQIDILMELLSKVKIGKEDVIPPNFTNLTDVALTSGQASMVILLLRQAKSESINIPNLTERFLRDCPDAITYLPQLVELGFEPTQEQYINSITPTNGVFEFVLNRGNIDANLLIDRAGNMDQIITLLRYVETDEQQDNFRYHSVLNKPLVKDNFENFATVMAYIPISKYDQIYFDLFEELILPMRSGIYISPNVKLITLKLNFLRERFTPTNPKRYIDLLFQNDNFRKDNAEQLLSFIPEPKAALLCSMIIKSKKNYYEYGHIWMERFFAEYFYKIDPSDPYSKELWINYDFIRYIGLNPNTPNWEEIMLNNILSGPLITLEYLLNVLRMRRYNSDIQLKLIAHLDQTPLSKQISDENFHFLNDLVYLTFVETILDLDPSLEYFNIFDVISPGFERVSELLTLLDRKVKPGVKIFIDTILTNRHGFYGSGSEKYFKEQFLPFLSNGRFVIHASTILRLRHIADKYIDILSDITVIEQKDVEDIVIQLSNRVNFSFTLVQLTQFMLEKKLDLDLFIKFLDKKDPYMSKLYLDESRYLIELSQLYMQEFKDLADNPNQFVNLFETLISKSKDIIRIKTVILYGSFNFEDLDLSKDMLDMIFVPPEHLLMESFLDFSIFILSELHDAQFLDRKICRLYLTRYMLSPNIAYNDIDQQVITILRNVPFTPEILEGRDEYTGPYNFADFIIYWLLLVSPQVYMELESKFIDYVKTTDLRIVDYALDFCGYDYDTIVLTILNDMSKSNFEQIDCLYINKLIHKSMERHKSPEIVNAFYSLCKDKTSTDMQQRINDYNLTGPREPCQKIIEDYPIFLFKESTVYQINYNIYEDNSQDYSDNEIDDT